MTSISYRQQVINALRAYEPYSWTEALAHIITDQRQPEPPPPIQTDPTTPPHAPLPIPYVPGYSSANPFEPTTPLKAADAAKPPVEIPPSNPPAPVEAKILELPPINYTQQVVKAAVHLIMMCVLFPPLGSVGMIYNCSLGGTKFVCAIFVYSSDKDSAKKLIEEAALHGAMAVHDYAVSIFPFIFGIGYAVNGIAYTFIGIFHNRASSEDTKKVFQNMQKFLTAPSLRKPLANVIIEVAFASSADKGIWTRMREAWRRLD